MNDDWRLRVEFAEEGVVHRALQRLNASELRHDLETAFHERVIVSVDRTEVFCYGSSREQLERAEAVIRADAQKHGWQITTELRRWHPGAEEWEDPDKPLPDDEAGQAAERAELMAKERTESAGLGAPSYEVRVTCSTRGQATELAEQLRAEGLPSVQHSNYVLIGALDEDGAHRLADRVRQRLPTDTIVQTEASAEAILAESGNPFAIFGGLGG